MLSKEEIETILEANIDIITYKADKEFRCLTSTEKTLLENNNKIKQYIKQLETKIKDLENIKDMKEAIELANMNIKDFVYFKYRYKELESNNQKLIEKLEERIKQITSSKTFDYAGTEWQESWVVEELQEILKIAKGEKE